MTDTSPALTAEPWQWGLKRHGAVVGVVTPQVGGRYNVRVNAPSELGSDLSHDVASIDEALEWAAPYVEVVARYRAALRDRCADLRALRALGEEAAQ